MGPLESLDPIRGYPVVSYSSGLVGTPVGIGLAVVAVVTVTGIAIKYRPPSYARRLPC